MAADDRNPADILSERLAPVLGVAKRTGFFQLVALLERMTPGSKRVGGDGPPAEEALRFRHSELLTFSTGDVQEAAVKKVPRDVENPMGPSRAVVEVVTTFLGLTGSSSPLPLYIAEEVNSEDPEIGAKRDFLDVFHHRLISIFYRAVTRYSPPRTHMSNERDQWLERALSLSGMDPTTYVPRCGIPPAKLMRLAPIVGRRGRGARALEMAMRIVLEEDLGPTGTLRIEEFAGSWVPVHKGQCSALGEHNSVLGQNAMLGVKVFDRSGRFQVTIGPLDAEGRDRFSEKGEAMQRLKACVALVVPEPLDFDVELQLEAGAMRPFRLSAQSPNKLGTNTRLGFGDEGEVVKMRNVGRFSPSSSEASAAG